MTSACQVRDCSSRAGLLVPKWYMMCVELAERLIKIILLYNVFLCTHILILQTHACISIVLLQTRDALKEEVSKHGLNIIHSVSFPTDQNPQPSVQSLQVSNCNEITQCCCRLLYFLIPAQESSGRIIFLNCYPNYAREILCQACANCSCPFQKQVLMHVLPCTAGFHIGHGTTKVCMDHIRMVS